MAIRRRNGQDGPVIHSDCGVQFRLVGVQSERPWRRRRIIATCKWRCSTASAGRRASNSPPRSTTTSSSSTTPDAAIAPSACSSRSSANTYTKTSTTPPDSRTPTPRFPGSIKASVKLSPPHSEQHIRPRSTANSRLEAHGTLQGWAPDHRPRRQLIGRSGAGAHPSASSDGLTTRRQPECFRLNCGTG
jgi:hypothetical protein